MTPEEDDELNLEELSPLMQALVPKVAACRVREFEPGDRDSCVEVFRSNRPDSISPDDLESFLQFLDLGTTYFLVIEHDGDVIACGGIEMVGDPDAATLVHSMVHREYQRRGFGSALLAAQLSLLEHDDRSIDLWTRADEEAAGFYERLGFERTGSPNADPGATVLWLNIAPEDIEDARAVLIERQIQLVLTAEEDEPEEDETGGEEEEV